jgi:hypothetical protein
MSVGANRIAFDTRTCGSSPCETSRYTMAVQTPRTLATSVTERSRFPRRSTTCNRPLFFLCTTGAANGELNGANGWETWTPGKTLF